MSNTRLLTLAALLGLALLLAASATSGAAPAGEAAELAPFSALTPAPRSGLRARDGLRLRLRSRHSSGSATSSSQSAHARARFALSTATFFGAPKVMGRGAGGRAGRTGPSGNAAQSGRKGGDAAAGAGQSGRKGGDAAGGGAQSGRKGGDTATTSAQSGRKGGDNAVIVSPILGNPPPSAANVVTVPVRRALREYNRPVQVYVRNQGDGPTCWAHSAVTLYEMALQMVLYKENDLQGWLSVDQVVKCVKSEKDGGNPLDALQFIMTHKLMLDSEVRAGKPITCTKRKWGIGERGHYSPMLVHKPCIKPGENCARMASYEDAMYTQTQMTPMLVWVDASAWFDYKPVYTPGRAVNLARVAFDIRKCSMDPAKGDHLVTLLGVDTDPRTGLQYWRAFNSWGNKWGVDGLIYLPFKKNACGLANYPVGLHGTLIDDGFNTSRPLWMVAEDAKWSEVMNSKEYKAGVIGLTGGIIDIL